jgi:hypothetical protein
MLIATISFKPLRFQYLEDSKRTAPQAEVREKPKVEPPKTIPPETEPPRKHPAKPTAKVPPQLPPVIQTARIYGNLKQRCWDLSQILIARPIKPLRDELAGVHIKGEELHNLLERDDRNEQFRSLAPGQPFYGAGWIDSADIRAI